MTEEKQCTAGEELWGLIETPQGEGFVSDVVTELPDEEVFIYARRALYFAEQAARRLRRFLNKHDELLGERNP